MEKDCECYEEEVQPYRKTDYKPIIYMLFLYNLYNVFTDLTYIIALYKILLSFSSAVSLALFIYTFFFL